MAAEDLTKTNSSLSEASNELSDKLDQVWKRMALVLQEKEAAEKRFVTRKNVARLNIGYIHYLLKYSFS